MRVSISELKFLCDGSSSSSMLSAAKAGGCSFDYLVANVPTWYSYVGFKVGGLNTKSVFECAVDGEPIECGLWKIEGKPITFGMDVFLCDEVGDGFWGGIYERI